MPLLSAPIRMGCETLETRTRTRTRTRARASKNRCRMEKMGTCKASPQPAPIAQRTLSQPRCMGIILA